MPAAPTALQTLIRQDRTHEESKEARIQFIDDAVTPPKRIAQIRAPLLVSYGEPDRLVAAANVKLIAKRIPGAKPMFIPAAGQSFKTGQHGVAHSAILDFLAAPHCRGQSRQN